MLVKAGLILAAKAAHHVFGPLDAVIITVHRVGIRAKGEVFAAQFHIPLQDSGVSEGIVRQGKAAGIDLNTLSKVNDMTEDGVKGIGGILVDQGALRAGIDTKFRHIADMSDRIKFCPGKDGFRLSLSVFPIGLTAGFTCKIPVSVIGIQTIYQVQRQLIEIERQ